MRPVQVIIYEAVDGRRFDSADECDAHEIDILNQLLATLDLEQIRAALKRVGITIRSDRLPTSPPTSEPAAQTETRQ